MTVEQQSIDVLVTEAREGSQAAWNALVDRYAALIWSVCRSFRLSDADGGDVSQTVWLRAVEHLATIREPAALPGWLVTTTRRECIKLCGGRPRTWWSVDAMVVEPASGEESAPDTEVLAAERRASVREALAQLPPHCQRLLAMLFEGEEHSYADISARLAIPVGSIGPTRSRCLGKLRDSPLIMQWFSTASTEQGS
jgi:RNA polymerase sigma factor (sigma-70 family)